MKRSTVRAGTTAEAPPPVFTPQEIKRIYEVKAELQRRNLSLASEWGDYRARHIPKRASSSQIKKYRDAFLAGAGAWCGLEAQIGSDEELFALEVELVELVTEDLREHYRSQQ